jgi:hypothetical protein
LPADHRNVSDAAIQAEEDGAAAGAAASTLREGVWSNGHRVTMQEEDEDGDDNLGMEAGEETDEDEETFWVDPEEDYVEYERALRVAGGGHF